jgi:hypothetical protein
VPDEPTQQALDAVRDGDPFIRAGVVQSEIWPWRPNIGVEGLDRL